MSGLAPPLRVAEAIRAAGYPWRIPDWAAAAHAEGFSTTRDGGVSVGPYASLNLGASNGDDPDAVAANRSRVAALLPTAPVWLRQVHGTAVATLDAANAATARRRPPVADAAVTAVPGIVCAVLTADCLPVLFADRAGGTVGVAHAGWRGLAAGVLEATLAALAQLGTPATRVCAWLGPAIGPREFEVGADVVEAFCAGDPGAAVAFAAQPCAKWRADLPALARRRLAAAGVPAVDGADESTHADAARFFSFRRDGATGRQGTFIWLRRPAPAAGG